MYVSVSVLPVLKTIFDTKPQAEFTEMSLCMN